MIAVVYGHVAAVDHHVALLKLGPHRIDRLRGIGSVDYGARVGKFRMTHGDCRGTLRVAVYRFGVYSVLVQIVYDEIAYDVGGGFAYKLRVDSHHAVEHGGKYHTVAHTEVGLTLGGQPDCQRQLSEKIYLVHDFEFSRC